MLKIPEVGRSSAAIVADTASSMCNHEETPSPPPTTGNLRCQTWVTNSSEASGEASDQANADDARGAGDEHVHASNSLRTIGLPR
jgi:hypothetical protein